MWGNELDVRRVGGRRAASRDRVEDDPALRPFGVPMGYVEQDEGPEANVVIGRGDSSGLDDERTLVLLGVVDVDRVVPANRIERERGDLGFV